MRIVSYRLSLCSTRRLYVLCSSAVFLGCSTGPPMMILNPLVVCYKFCVHYMPDCIKLLMHFELLLTSLNRVDDRFYVAAGQG